MTHLENNTSNILEPVGKAAKEASYSLASLHSAEKKAMLLALADALEANAPEILQANAEDCREAKAADVNESLHDRLLLNPQRLAAIAFDVRAVSALPDPVGEVLDGRILDSGLSLLRRRVPLGVVAAIYEARPNVTVDVTALCLKTGNAVILRGGKETARSNKAIVNVIQNCLQRLGLPPAAVQAVTSPDRALVSALLHLDAYVDMLIPRGGSGLHRLCREQSRIPVITGGIGVCHIVVDASAEQDKALRVIENAKIQRPSACNAVETVLVHRDIAAVFLPRLAKHLGALGVTLHASDKAMPYLARQSFPSLAVTPLAPGDYDKEWLTLDMNVHVIDSLTDALEHIRLHGTTHSEAILTESMTAAERFAREVDASSIYINASTRFTDGGQFGLGAEVAISTQKLHARGPMGLDALTTYKWIATGDYTIRE
ncbi:MAG: glutamate-5-semialdehyde dehydrogenase [Desulfovibrio sp.]|jgi:glutamate-5-semialdehyde dehydrogenase|nr:glutamate-5-semialdehyde dehydrogenase [Desulfovibrio sp.]